MKKTISLMMFTLLVVAGYYIGTAVAQNNNAAMPKDGAAMSDTPAADNVMVIEEEYEVIAPAADTSAQPSAVKNVKAPAASTNNSLPAKNNNMNTPADVVETITEEGYVVEQ